MFYKHVSEFYFEPIPIFRIPIFSKIDQIAALYCRARGVTLVDW